MVPQKYSENSKKEQKSTRIEKKTTKCGGRDLNPSRH